MFHVPLALGQPRPGPVKDLPSVLIWWKLMIVKNDRHVAPWTRELAGVESVRLGLVTVSWMR